MALEEDESSKMGTESVKELMEIVDTYIELPKRELDLPILLSVESTLVVRGRGTVVTGKLEQGILRIMMKLN